MERSHILYWIWLSLCISPGTKSSDILMEHFGGSAQRVFEASDAEYDALKLTERVKSRLKNKDSAEARKIYYWCRDNGVRLLSYDDPAFPERLRNIPRRPILLYMKGVDVDFNNDLLIATVGTRRMTSYGQRTAYSLIYDLACAGTVIVSGLALGVDAVCHRAALDASGTTVAFIGCGIDVVYPKENKDLMEEIERKGAVLSEFRPGMRPDKGTFPLRNRLVSGICQGALMVEGPEKSGAMITMRCAADQGRTLFVLPGMVGEMNSGGPNLLLREGAIPVIDAKDILNVYDKLYPDRIFPERIPAYRHEITLTSPAAAAKAPAENQEQAPANKEANVPAEKKSPAKSRKSAKSAQKKAEDAAESPLAAGKGPRRAPPSLSEAGKKIYEALAGADEPLCADEIISGTKLSCSEVLTQLTLMEISGVVTPLPGGRFTLNN